MSISQTRIWMFGFVIAFMLAMSGPLTHTLQKTVDIDKQRNHAPEETATSDTKSAEQPIASEAHQAQTLPRIDPARSPADHLDELPMHLASIGGNERLPSGPLPPGPLPDTSFSPFPFQRGVDAAIHAGPPIPAPSSLTQASIDARTRADTSLDPGTPQPSEAAGMPLSFYADMVEQAMNRTAHDAITLAKLDPDATPLPDMQAEPHDRSAGTHAPIFYADMLAASIHVSIANDRMPSAPPLLTQRAIDIAWTKLFARELPAATMPPAPTPRVALVDATLQAEPFDLAQWNAPDDAHSDLPPFELDGQHDVAPPYSPADTLSSSTPPTNTDSPPDTRVARVEAMRATDFESADGHAAALCSRPLGADERPMEGHAIGLSGSGMEMLVMEQFASSARAASDYARECIHDRPTAFVNSLALPRPSDHFDSSEDASRITFLPRFANDPFQSAFSMPDDTLTHWESPYSGDFALTHKSEPSVHRERDADVRHRVRSCGREDRTGNRSCIATANSDRSD